MSATVALPLSIGAAKQRCIDTENGFGKAAVLLQSALCGLRKAAELLERDPTNAGYRYAATVTLAHLRDQETTYRLARTQCEAARVDLVVAMSSAVGLCARCGDTMVSAPYGPYCDECLDDSVPF